MFYLPLDIYIKTEYNLFCCRRYGRTQGYGRLAQLGEHLPYKQRVTGSSPVVPTIFGPVVQLVRMPACHAGGRGFEPHPDRQKVFIAASKGAAIIYASVAQLVEQGTENPRVGGSIPPGGTSLFSEVCMREWLSGRASPCQGERREFESRLPLQYDKRRIYLRLLS